MQANQSADAEGYGDPEDEDEPVAAGDDDDDSWSVSNADSSEDEDEHENAIGQLKTVLEFQMLGSLLASTDMSNHPVDTFMATLRHCAMPGENHPYRVMCRMTANVFTWRGLLVFKSI